MKYIAILGSENNASLEPSCHASDSFYGLTRKVAHHLYHIGDILDLHQFVEVDPESERYMEELHNALYMPTFLSCQERGDSQSTCASFALLDVVTSFNEYLNERRTVAIFRVRSVEDVDGDTPIFLTNSYIDILYHGED